MQPIVTLDELKQYLGITGTADDLLLASIASNATETAQRDTSRIFAVSSNVTHRYSTDGQSAITIHDRPYFDSTRTVTWIGAVQTEEEGYWLLPDRRNPDTSHTIQLRHFDRTGTWYKADPGWFDKNLDKIDGRGSTPNDLVISGTVGHPVIPRDVKHAVTVLAALMFWDAKSGGSGVVQSPTGEQVDLAALQDIYARFVQNWRIRTAVAVVG